MRHDHAILKQKKTIVKQKKRRINQNIIRKKDATIGWHKKEERGLSLRTKMGLISTVFIPQSRFRLNTILIKTNSSKKKKNSSLTTRKLLKAFNFN